MVVLHFIVTAIIFGPIVSSLSPKEFPFLKTQINDEKHAAAFNKLLNSIVKTNRKRLDSINKLNKLQAMDVYPSLQDSLRTSSRRDSDESSSENNENIIYLVLPDSYSIPNASQHTQRVEPPAPTTAPPKPSKPPVRSQPQPPQDIPTLQDYTKLKGPNPSPPLTNPSPSIQTLSKEGLDALRVSIERSCKSKEVKRCRNACQAAVKSACDEYECRKKLKKKLKKTCKTECKEKFKSGW
ncbi:WASH complex subunit homolog 1-like [Cydia amplana]|uniref:WASH complex subunit homolog 1-like n=1 Tax=Cydia amplana TaxID=1869771 RepID=UPI002FE639D7